MLAFYTNRRPARPMRTRKVPTELHAHRGGAFFMLNKSSAGLARNEKEGR